MFEIVDGRRTDDGRTDDGRTPEHGYTISSPCEPNGSGELKNWRPEIFELNGTIVSSTVIACGLDSITLPLYGQNFKELNHYKGEMTFVLYIMLDQFFASVLLAIILFKKRRFM